jgi:hypothetical protein
MRIKLTEAEISKCSHIARNWDTTTGKYQIKWQQDKQKVSDDTLNGVKYEMVVAKALNIDYNGDIGKPGKFDVGGKYEVRGTKYPNGCLLLHPEDKEAIYVLVTGCGNEFNIVGWINGSEGKNKQYWRTDVRYPCYFVPQNKLKNISLLVKQ